MKPKLNMFLIFRNNIFSYRNQFRLCIESFQCPYNWRGKIHSSNPFCIAVDYHLSLNTHLRQRQCKVKYFPIILLGKPKVLRPNIKMGAQMGALPPPQMLRWSGAPFNPPPWNRVCNLSIDKCSKCDGCFFLCWKFIMKVILLQIY